MPQGAPPANLGRRAFVGGVATLALASCRPAARRASRELPARRVVSLTPSTTETVFALGAGERLVGRSRYCDWPPEAKRLPVVGGYVDASLEAVLGLRPDLVVGARGPAGASLVERLEARGIATYFPPTESFAEIEAMMGGLAGHLGKRADADRLLGAFRERLARIATAVEPLPRPRTLLVFGLAPVVAAGPDSFAGEMLARAGGANVLGPGPRYPTLGLEAVLGLDPDVILDAAIAEGHGRLRIGAGEPGWGAVRAVRRGRVLAVDDNAVLRPGPRAAEGVGTLARLLHPGEAVP
jgi:iron complex transport system substrate-binding protein